MRHNHHQGTNTTTPTNPQPQITNRTHKSQIEPTSIRPTTTISTVAPEIQQPKCRNLPKPNPATQISKPHTDLNPDTNAHRSKPRPSGGVKVREAISIHEAGAQPRSTESHFDPRGRSTTTTQRLNHNVERVCLREF